MEALKYDGKITIAEGKSRKSVKWRNRTLLWSELLTRLAKPTHTPETQCEYFAMKKPQRDEIKDVGGFVGGTLTGGRRKADNIKTRQLITLDLDAIPAGVDPWPEIQSVFPYASAIYSTHSHRDDAPRLRFVAPISRQITPDEYPALSRMIASVIGIDMCDDTTFEPQRLMYWPSAPIDAEYHYGSVDAPWIDADEWLAKYSDWTNPDEWPVSSRQGEALTKHAKAQGDPKAKPGVVGAFNRVYSIEDAIETFLSGVYMPCGYDRYTYAGGSTAGGLVLYDEGEFAFSHHGSDPVSGRLCNAFDLVRLHLFSEKDDDALPDTPINRLPSFLAMSELALKDAAVKENLAEWKLKETMAAFDDDDTDWAKNLDQYPDGRFKATRDNVYKIMLNDPNIKDSFYFDEFRERPAVSGDLPWQDFSGRVTACWTDTDDSGLRQYLERRFNIDNVLKTHDGVDLAMMQRKRHPVREYLQGLEWDDRKRADTVFIDYLGAADTEYTREVTRKALLGAVARIMEPGCKHDHILTLVGPQGSLKSTTLAKLGKSWFSDSLYTVSGKEAYEQLQGFWIIEMGEMAAFRKAELEQIKQFTSKQSDSYRSAYARKTQEHPRQCAFFGSTNDEEFLRDPTGGRRFWPVVVTDKGRETAELLTGEIVDQIWAEIVTAYKSGENWYLSNDLEVAARAIQAEHMEINGKQGLIEEFLEVLLPEDWADRDLDARLLFLSNGFGDKETGTMRRTRVCALEIWRELFCGDPKAFTQSQAREINGILRCIPGWKSHASRDCGKLYGRQRAFVR